MTRIDGSGIRTPSWMSASNDVVPLAPEVDVVVGGVRPAAAPRTPATHSRHDGEYAPAAGGPRRVDAAEQRAVGDRQVGVAHDGVGGDALAAAELDAGDRCRRRRAGSRVTGAS